MFELTIPNLYMNQVENNCDYYFEKSCDVLCETMLLLNCCYVTIVILLYILLLYLAILLFGCSTVV